MNTNIKADLHRMLPGDFEIKKILIGLRSQGFRYLYLLRTIKSKKNIFAKILLRILLRHYTYKFGFQIPFKTEIGGGFYIGHFGTIVISVNAKIGRNCNIAHNVTIGAARGERAGAPEIGDLVWIGTGAVIVGNIKIGNNVLIAPNAYVNFDVPDNSLVLGNPGKIIPKDNPTKDYIHNAYPFEE